LYNYNVFFKILENTSFLAPSKNTRISYVTTMQGPHQDIQGEENDESSNSIGHEDYHFILIRIWKPFSVSLSIGIFI
jgi:hypothetical protein